MTRSRQRIGGGEEHGDARPATRPAGGHGHGRGGDGDRLRPGEASVLHLQRSAGNAAMARALHVPRSPAGHVLGRISVQRHASFEHTLLGNTPPTKLGNAAVSKKDKNHLLGELWAQTIFFSSDPTRDPRSRFPDLRWIKLRGSGLWVSYGELNALADYLPDSQHIDGLGRDIVEPVLQRMRRGTSGQLLELGFKGEAGAGGWELLPSVASEKAVEGATQPLGSQRYFGLLTRNACHFAPYSWHRWARFHEEARDHALAYHRGKHEKAPVKDIDTTEDEHLRQAWLKNGYGDHFLQDSFAAGHLINKTLVMQWFVDYVNGLSSKWWDLLGRAWWGDDTKPWYGMPDDEVMSAMGASQQPGMSGRGLYSRPTDGSAGTTSMDRDLGDRPTDPQTAWERGTHDQRVGGSGVQAGGGRTKEQNYQIYLRFLNSSFLQLAAGMTHDYFNERGLAVANDRGDTLHVGGDNTLLSKSGRLGAEVAADAAQKSQKAIDDLSRTGATGISVEQISAMFPNKVWVGSGDAAKAMPLEQWHDDVLHEICEKEIFPDVVDSFNSKVARAGQPELLKEGLQDVPSPPPVPTNMGDFPMPAGDRGTG